MSKFIKELRSSDVISGIVDECDRDQACAGDVLEFVEREFKDWQPPRRVKMTSQDIKILKSATNIVDFWNACTEFYSDEDLAWAWLHPELVEVKE